MGNCQRSKATIIIDIQNVYQTEGNVIEVLQETAELILVSETPSKQKQKLLVETSTSLLVS